MRRARERPHRIKPVRAEKIIISGGGIAGLALALALKQRGKSAIVYERDNHFGEGQAPASPCQPAYRTRRHCTPERAAQLRAAQVEILTSERVAVQ